MCRCATTCAAYMREKHGTGRDFDDVLITSGAQQIMDLFTKSILNEGETVLCEAPSFIGTLNDFRPTGRSSSASRWIRTA